VDGMDVLGRVSAGRYDGVKPAGDNKICMPPGNKLEFGREKTYRS
jgi:hypothetical protein